MADWTACLTWDTVETEHNSKAVHGRGNANKNGWAGCSKINDGGMRRMLSRVSWKMLEI